MERDLFLTDYLRVSYYKVLQLEVHPLNLSPPQSRRVQRNVIWFADRHLQEILQLVKDVAINRTSLAPKEASSTTSQLLTGQTVRLGYAFRKKEEHQSCLILRDNLPYSGVFSETEKTPINGRYRNYQVHREKMVIYVLPLEKGKPSGMQKILSALNDEKKMQVEISDYFVRSPQPKDECSQMKLPMSQNSNTETGHKVPDTDVKISKSGVRSVMTAGITCLEPDSSSAHRSQPADDLILIEDSDSVDWVTDQGRMEPGQVSGKQDRQKTIRHTLQKCTNTLSKQYKRKIKLTRKPAEYVCPMDDLPDIRSSGDSNREWLSSKQCSETWKDTQETGNSESQTKHCEDSYGVRKNQKTNRAMLGLMGSESDASNKPTLGRDKKNRLKMKAKKNHTEKTEQSVNDSDAEDVAYESSEEDRCVLDTSTSQTLKKNLTKTSLFSENSDLEDKKRKLSGSCENPPRLRKSVKLSQLVSPQECESEPVSPSMKHCSVPLMKLSETSLKDSSASATSAIQRKGKLLKYTSPSPTKQRLSKRVSEVFQECEKFAEVIDLDSDAEGELHGILQESQSCTQLRKDEEHVEAMWTAVRSVKEMSDISGEDLIFIVHQNENYLRDIFQGKTFCQRHQDYKAGGIAKKSLIYQVYFGTFSDEQGDLVMNSLLSIFCKKHNKYLDYLMKVLLPEMFVKIYMDVKQISHEEAIAMIQAC